MNAVPLPANRRLYYGGGWHEPMSGTFGETTNPATGEVLATIPVAGPGDVDAAVRAAHAAFAQWRCMPATQRGALLREAAAIIREHGDELAMLDSLDTGNRVAMLRGDAGFAAAGIKYFAGLAPAIKGETIPMADENLNYTLREPLGVVARIVAYTIR